MYSEESSLEEELQRIHTEHVIPNHNQTQKNVKDQQRMIQKLVNAMLELDSVFSTIYHSIYWSGSYYDDLIVDKPDEFDVCIAMDLKNVRFELENQSSRSASAKLRVWNSEGMTRRKWKSYKETLEGWLGQGGCLKQDLFRQWFQSLMSRALSEVEECPNNFRMSGPACTLSIRRRNIWYDIDVVPALVIPEDQWPEPPIRQPESWFETSEERFFLLPKPRRNQSPGETDWLLDFHDQEREMLNDRYYLIPALRLMKQLRDVQGWKEIKSFFIKNMFFLEVENQDDDFWKQGMAVVFLRMLRVFRKYLFKRNLPFFWDERLNMLEGIPTNRINAIKRQVNSIINDIEGDPSTAEDYLVNDM